MNTQLQKYFVSPDSSIRDALASIDRNSQGIVLVVSEEHALLGTITDGDVRRAMLANTLLDQPLTLLLADHQASGRKPVTAGAGTPETELLQMMAKHSIRQIPLIGACGRVIDIVFLGDLIKQCDAPLRAMIMAGGFGKRLRPLTDNMPKPMLPVGDRPLLQRTIEQLRAIGVRHFDVATHYRGDVIANHFGDGHDFGVNIGYIREDLPLGTAGALTMLGAFDEPLLIINGDILTQVNFRAMVDYHRAHKAALTVGVRQYDIQVPYGVVECTGHLVSGISEKPKLSFFVNAGIYVLDPAARSLIPPGRRFDMTDLIGSLVSHSLPVVSFPIAEYWLDVGCPLDYEQAQRDVVDGRIPA